jgi:hypothetical protein
LNFPCGQSYLVSPISRPAARHSSVIPLHRLLPDVPSAPISPARSGLLAIISWLTRGFASTLATGWQLIHRKCDNDATISSHAQTIDAASEELTIPRENCLRSNGCPDCLTFNQKLRKTEISYPFDLARSKFQQSYPPISWIVPKHLEISCGVNSLTIF